MMQFRQSRAFGVPVFNSFCQKPMVKPQLQITREHEQAIAAALLPELLTASWRAGAVCHDVDFVARTVAYCGCNSDE
jgi:hypothetical protein